MARPATITAPLRREVAMLLARGLTHRAVADEVGIGLRTLDRWLGRAAKAEYAKRSTGKVPAADKPYLELALELVAAEEQADLQALRELGQYLGVGGIDLITAANAARVPLRQLERLQLLAGTIANRRDDGDRLEPDQVELLRIVDGFNHALAVAKVTMLGSIQRAGGNDWHAAAWFLERMFPDEFSSPAARKGRSGVGGRPIGATSAPDRPSTAEEPPPRIRLREVR